MNSTFETGGDGATATTHDWLTPPEILQALGPFDMDPCASQHQPWRTATTQFTIEDDGLARAWVGRVWCNPPYGPHAEKFLKRAAEHGNAVVLIFARTETKAFQEFCWRRASGMLFMAGRIRFRLPGGGCCWTSWGPIRPDRLRARQRRGAAQQRVTWLLRAAAQHPAPTSAGRA